MIGPDETAGQLHDRMKKIGADLMVKTVNSLIDGDLKEIPQTDLKTPSIDKLTSAPKISTSTAEINWTMPGMSIHNLIRGLSPYPGAFTKLNGKIFKILRSSFESSTAIANPGTFKTDGKTYLRFACIDGYISCLEVQMEGKRKMGIEEFLRGQRFVSSTN
jgi:methionyl-tRNA formyltransferase